MFMKWFQVPEWCFLFLWTSCVAQPSRNSIIISWDYRLCWQILPICFFRNAGLRWQNFLLLFFSFYFLLVDWEFCTTSCDHVYTPSFKSSQIYVLSLPNQYFVFFPIKDNFSSQIFLGAWPSTGAWLTYLGLQLETKQPFLSQQLTLVNSSSARNGIFPSMLAFDLAWVYAGLVHWVTTASSSHVQMCSCPDVP